MNKLKIFIILLEILGGSWLFFPSLAKAQEFSLSIWPPVLEVTIIPGKGITQVYKLKNNGNTELAITSKIIPFLPEGEKGGINLLEESSQSSLENLPQQWISFQNADLKLGEKFLLSPGKEKEIVLKIKVPADAPERDYYLTLLFETIPDLFLGQSGGNIQTKLGTNILLTVSQTDQLQKEAIIEEFRLLNCLSSQFCLIDSFTSPGFLIRVKNIGKTFFKPQGEITIKGWLGQNWKIPLLGENILANSIRQLTCAFQKEENIFPSPCQLSTKFLLGHYDAYLIFDPDGSSQKYQAKIDFWAFPLKLVLGVTAVLGLLIIAKKVKKIGY